MIIQYFIVISLALCAHGMKLHEHMTKQEIESTFNCDHRLVHEVEYEVTPLLHVDKISSQGREAQKSHSAVHLKAFDKNISLYLSENENSLLGSSTPLFMAKNIQQSAKGPLGSSQIVYSKIPFPMPEELKLYHDMKNRAAVTVFTDDDNQAHVYGTIGEDYVIKPIPKRLHKEVLPMLPEFQQSSFSYQSRDPFSGNSLKGNFYEPTHHIVMKPKMQVHSAYYDPHSGRRVDTPWPQQSFVPRSQFNWQSELKLSTKKPFQSPKIPMKQSAPSKKPVNPHLTSHNTTARPGKQTTNDSETVYPELLVSVDYETFETHRKNISEFSKYMAAFWNAVDLRFREMSHPKVRINIAGFIIPQTRDSAPYFENSRWQVKRTIFLAEEALSKVGKYFAHKDKFPNTTYDIVVAMSHQNLGSIQTGGKMNEYTTGIAWLKGACKVSSGLASAVIRDRGSFNGITTAAHELAHSMGVPHDDKRGLRGGPCSWSNGYLMSYDRKDSKGMHWSDCSQQALRKYLLSPEANCMRNKPNVGKPYPKFLPGKILSRDEQCKRSLGNGAFSNKKLESNCAILHCQRHVSKTKDVLVSESRPPAEGSYCGEGSICLDAQCVKDPTLHGTH